MVSIIIPTFNRAHLIGETLNSILAQTFLDWECIIVDDGSTDHTEKVVESYIKKDNRFKYHQRPKEHLPGGNGARNYGLKKATGTYVVFFDSDDLMTTDHIEVKINAIHNSNYDYVISKTKNISGIDERLEVWYALIRTDFTAENYIMQHINWLTPDVCIKNKLAKSISFNEVLKSGQEYNYFSKLVMKSVNALFVEKHLTLRRIHEQSIRSGLKNRPEKMISAYVAFWVTYLDIRDDANTQIKKRLLFICITMIYKDSTIRYPHQFSLIKTVFKEFGIWEGINFVLMLYFNKYFKKGYTFRQNIKKKIVEKQFSN